MKLVTTSMLMAVVLLTLPVQAGTVKEEPLRV
jgi:hypothetical protein